MTWIPVLEKNPPDLQQVLIFDEVNEYVIGFYYEAGGYFMGNVDGARINNARFWKSLPELPAEKDQNIPQSEKSGQLIDDAVEQI